MAGFFDGEGCVFVRTNLSGVQIDVAQKRPEVLHQIAESLGYGKVNLFSSGMYHYQVSKAEKVADFLRMVLPYLVVKREESEIALSYLEHLSSRYFGKHNPLTEEDKLLRATLKRRMVEARA